MDTITKALHARIDVRNAGAVVTPLYQTSAFHADSPYFYTRKDNPNIKELEETISILEDARYGIAVSTGMAAILCATSLIKPGSCIVLHKHIYGCSAQYFIRLAQRERSKLLFLDLSTREGIEAIPENTAMVFFETPTNPFLYTISIRNVAEQVKKHNPECLVVVDNTWATPLNQHPLKHGADISLHSATKFMSGHCDVMGGIVLCDNEQLAEELRAIRFYGGIVLDPHSAWLIRRSLQTLALRMRVHSEVTRDMAQWLASLPEIEQVYYPETGNGQLHDYGGIVFFQLKPEYKKRYEIFRDALTLFDTGTGMAAVTSMVAQPFSGSHASLDLACKTEMGLDEGLVRLCFGFETVALLKEDIEQALHKVRCLD